ncbi:MAG: FHA domain-containing protein [Verrucomicrobia bacterium]|jgi:hypothetical protein|nr:FHA domain-containing protein [Verrucomicrobiota bacterium]
MKNGVPTDVEMLTALKAAVDRYPSARHWASTRASHGRCIQAGVCHRGDAFAADDWILLRAVSGAALDITFPVSGMPMTIGRTGGSANYGVECAGVSRIHCRFECDMPFVRLVDANSKNGTLLNGEAITSAYVAHGDMVGIGKAMFCLERA